MFLGQAYQPWLWDSVPDVNVADLLSWDWLSHCWEEPSNRCCSRTGLCGGGLKRRRGTSEHLATVLDTLLYCQSYHSSSCRWIFFGQLRCSRGGRGWTSQTVGRGTLGSLYLRAKERNKTEMGIRKSSIIISTVTGCFGRSKYDKTNCVDEGWSEKKMCLYI